MFHMLDHLDTGLPKRRKTPQIRPHITAKQAEVTLSDAAGDHKSA